MMTTAAQVVGVLLAIALVMPSVAYAGDRLLATGGASQIEGAGGGGLTPWALIAGYGTRDQVGGALFYTLVDSADSRLQSSGIAIGVHDRVEISLARQSFRQDEALQNRSIRQEIVGLKVRVAGDAIFAPDEWLPQVALGLQYKKNRDMQVPLELGARHGSGTDFYLSASKLYLAGLAGRNVLLNATLRATKANQLGLLGFGGDKRDRYQAQLECSAVMLINDYVALGVEYRAKPDNLSAFREDDFSDVFATWFINKKLAVTAAYTRMGQIVDKKNQNGVYFSLQISH